MTLQALYFQIKKHHHHYKEMSIYYVEHLKAQARLIYEPAKM